MAHKQMLQVANSISADTPCSAKASLLLSFPWLEDWPAGWLGDGRGQLPPYLVESGLEVCRNSRFRRQDLICSRQFGLFLLWLALASMQFALCILQSYWQVGLPRYSSLPIALHRSALPLLCPALPCSAMLCSAIKMTPGRPESVKHAAATRRHRNSRTMIGTGSRPSSICIIVVEACTEYGKRCNTG